jgi:preprotein translocase subunit SecY
LRKKIIYTMMLITVYRIGCYIPVPLLDKQALSDFMEQQMRGGGVFGLVNMFTGGAFEKMTIFALGIMPYITAQIVIQMLIVISPRLEKISKEGEIGKRKINRFTRYGTIGLTAFQAIGLSIYLISQGLKLPAIWSSFFVLTATLAMTTGTAFIMWLGERITEEGIGNGISLIIALGIIAYYPGEIKLLIDTVLFPGDGGSVINPVWVPISIVLLLVVSWGIVMIQEGARRIPIQHARRVVGRRVMGGQANVLPLKVNTAGVIPVIFSSAILTMPGLILAGVGSGAASGFGVFFQELFAFESRYSLHALLPAVNGLIGFTGLPIALPDDGIFLVFKSFNMWMLMFVGLTGFFCFFYTAVTFNPIDVADNLKKSGSFIPGYRPGKPTAAYIDFVLTRITVIGAFFLVSVAALPYVLVISFNMPVFLMNITGGTGLIIVVGVILQTVQQLEAQLLTHNYEGLRVRRRRRGEVGTGSLNEDSRSSRRRRRTPRTA